MTPDNYYNDSPISSHGSFSPQSDGVFLQHGGDDHSGAVGGGAEEETTVLASPETHHLIQQYGTSTLHHDDGYGGEEDGVVGSIIEKEERVDKHKSTYAQAFFNIIKANVGSGILGMPYAFMHSGTVLGLVVLAIMGVVATMCTLMLVRCKTALQKRFPERQVETYGDVGRLVYGRPGGAIIEIALGFTQVGFCIAYLIFIGGNMASMLSFAGGWAFICISVVILVPICLLRNMRYLAPFSLLSEVVIFLGMGIVYYYDIVNIKSLGDFFEVKLFDPWNFPIFFGIAVYSFEGIGIALPVHGSMKKPHQFKWVLICALTFYAGLLMTFGLLGYVAFKEETLDVVSLNLPNNIYSMVVKIGLIVGLLLTYPIQLFPVSQMLDLHLSTIAEKGFKSEESLSRFRRLFKGHIENMVRIAILLLTAVLAIAGADLFGLVLSLIGGLGGSGLAFVFPALIHLRVFWKDLRWYHIMGDIIIIVIGIMGGTVTTIMSIQNIIAAIVS